MPLYLWATIVFAIVIALSASVYNAPRVATAPPTQNTIETVTDEEVVWGDVPTASEPVVEASPFVEPAQPAATTPISQPPASQPVAVAVQPTQSEFESAAEALRAALVNIFCISGRRDIISISGSGVIVDPRGIIITNAHIAQYFLLAGDPALEVSCMIRAGSPAKDLYRGSLMFLPPSWVAQNADILTKDDPTGNGEYDFAFIAITGSATASSLPSIFAHVPLGEGDAHALEPVIIGAYAAQFLSSSQLQSALFPTLVYGSIKEVFTFVATTIDVITLGGSAAAQEGSSGGGVARTDGTLGGLITTSTIEGDTSARTLGGITALYIRRAYEAETGTTLTTLMSKSPVEAAASFAPQIPALRALLTAALSQ